MTNNKLKIDKNDNNKRNEEKELFELNVENANNCIDKDNWDDAYQYLKKAVEINPEYVDGYNRLGIYYARNSNYPEAIVCFKKALQIDFDLVDIHYNLASIYMGNEEYNMALPHFKEVVLENPDDADTYNLMGMCCVKCDMEKEAESFFTETLRLQPDSLSAVINLSKLLIKKEENAKAKEILLYTLHKGNINSDVNFLLGIIYKLEENYTRAMHHLRETLLEDKNNKEAYNLLGECCVKTNLEQQAETFLKMAAKLDTSYATPFYNLGNLYYKQQRYQDAICSLEEYIKTKEATDFIDSLWSDNKSENEVVPIYNLLGSCYKIIQNPAMARTMWEKSLSIQSDQQEIKDALAELSQSSQMHKRISLTID